MEKTASQGQDLLRNALIGNAIFSFVSGVITLSASRWLAGLLGLHDRVGLIVLAFGLIAYAVTLVFNARKPKIKLSDAWMAVVADAVWVVGSYTILLTISFNSTAKWLVVIIAEIVFAFALLQWLGIRRMQRASLSAPVLDGPLG